MYENVWLGSNELAIVSCDGNYCVRERDLDYKTVFRGNYEECFKYCEKRYSEYENEWFKYMESLID